MDARMHILYIQSTTKLRELYSLPLQIVIKKEKDKLHLSLECLHDMSNEERKNI